MLAILAMAAMARPVAVMIHGAGGGGWEWDAWRPVFQKAGWEVVAKDLVPGKGGLAATKLEDYVRQVISWCPRNRPFVLIGASMGGPIALRVMARTNPRAIVLVNGVPPTGTGKKKYPPVVRWAGGPLKDSRDAMPDSDEATIRKAWKLWRDESGEVMTELSAGARIEAPKVPVLVVIGGKDADVAPSGSRALADLYRADVLEYAEMSHVGPLLGRKAPDVAEAVAEWLRGPAGLKPKS